MNIPTLIIQIDDDEINNFINESIFKANSKGVEIKSFTDPLKALDYIKEEYILNPVPAVVFLDINMPQMSGWEILDQLKGEIETLKNFMTVYIISSSIDSIDIAKSNNHPLVKDFVSKPLSTKVIKKIFGISN